MFWLFFIFALFGFITHRYFHFNVFDVYQKVGLIILLVGLITVILRSDIDFASQLIEMIVVVFEHVIPVVIGAICGSLISHFAFEKSKRRMNKR